MCQVVTCSSHGWGDLEFLVLGSSLLPAPINCQLFWERILFPPSLSEEAQGERGAPSGYDGWVACRVVVSNTEHLNWDTPSLLYVLMQHIHVSHDLLSTNKQTNKKMQPLWAIKMSESNCEEGWTSYDKIKANEMMSCKFLKSTVKTSKNWSLSQDVSETVRHVKRTLKSIGF